MKTPLGFIKSCFLLAAVLLLSAGCSTATGQDSPAATTKVRVGVYDSRAIAVAWANSTEFKNHMKTVQAEHQKAKEDKDDQRVKEIESQMQLHQRRAHEQGFSTGSVIPIVARIKDQLPAVAKAAEVQIIISKWELNHAEAAVEQVDVTDRLVALFDVSEQGLKWCKQLQQKAPLPVEKITEHMD